MKKYRNDTPNKSTKIKMNTETIKKYPPIQNIIKTLIVFQRY